MDLFFHLIVAFSVTCLKFLLMPSYLSTDFEVHRNWLAITYNKPLTEWYYENTSQWTLDYPPLFAWFEFGLAQFAPMFDAKMLKISAKQYTSYQAIFFQRLTVIITDFIYVFAAFEWAKIIKTSKKLALLKVKDQLYHPTLVLSFLFLWNPGLLMVDHIHFQYNGLLSGIFLLSIARMVQQKELESAFLFAILLNMKHIYLYVSPVYFIYLLRVFCFDEKVNFKQDKFIKLALVVGGVFAFSWAPFIITGQTTQLLKRLFPFDRGLTHAYWAPNFWALYNGLDKFLAQILGKKEAKSVMTRGLVEKYSHSVLPSVPPFSTTILCLISLTPLLINLWRKCGPTNRCPSLFTRSVVVCAFASFIFGYHVHEKAILMVLLPLTPLALVSVVDANIYFLLSTLGTFSLFPLLFQDGEFPTKVCLLVLFAMFCHQALSKIHSLDGPNAKERLLQTIDLIYLLFIPLLLAYDTFASHLLNLHLRYPFLPLLLISTYCALGINYLFIKSYFLVLNRNAGEF